VPPPPPAPDQRKKTFQAIFVLLLVAAWPFANFLYANVAVNFEFWHVVGYGAGTFAFFLAVFFLGKLLFRKSSSLRISLILCAVIIALFNFDNILQVGEAIGIPQQRYSAIVWIVLAGLLIWAASRFARLSRAWSIATVAAAVMFVVPTAGFILHKAAYAPESEIASSDTRQSRPAAVKIENPRNVYFIVPDSYPRSDVLRNVYGYDNSRFVDALRTRGFKVAERSYANYYTTFLSMSSMFNMAYHDRIVRPEGLAANFLERLGAYGYSEKRNEIVTIGNSAFLNTLKSYGYAYFFAGVFHCDESMDFCLARSWIFIPDNLSRLTPFELVRSFVRWHFNWNISIPNLFGTPLYLELPEIIELRPGPEHAPIYFYIHLMMPHAPYRYHADCSEIRETVFIRDAFVEDAIPYFNGQVECLNSQIIGAVDTILADDPTADIVIQADTGTILLDSFHTPTADWTEAQFEETYAVFSAVKLDKPCMNNVPDAYTSVNLTRIVLSCVDGIERPRLPDISYKINQAWELVDGQFIDKVEHAREP
jgi:hypothetical protein